MERQTKQDVHDMEHRAARTWPAEESVPLNGWLLRASGGISRRANSVMTAGVGPDAAAGWLEDVESFYRVRAVAPAFQVTTAAPDGLDELLARHGYVKEMPCLLMTAGTSDVRALAQRQEQEREREAGQRRYSEVEVRVAPRADERWLHDFVRLEQFPPERLPFYRGLCARMPEGAAFFSLVQDGATVAIATLIGEDGWGGIMNVAVDERLRGQGLGRRLMGAMADYGLRTQTDRLYLQVMVQNEPAYRLYTRLGFAISYEYHYRVKINR